MTLRCEAKSDNEVKRSWVRAELENIGVTAQENNDTIYCVVRNAPALVERQLVQTFLRCPIYTITRYE